MSRPAEVLRVMLQQLDGLLAVNKPRGITSAGVVRYVQSALIDPSANWRDFGLQVVVSNALDSSSSSSNKDARKRPRKTAWTPNKSIVKERIQCGHGGTLDPDASGVLVLGLGKRGCKMLGQQLLGGKAYEATMIFGIETTTGDQSGTSLKTALPVSPDLITREHISAVLPRFRGKISQLPPLYSAIKINGKPMYEYARAGETPPREIAERIVEISRLELVDYPSPSTVNGVDWSFKSPLLNEAQGEYQTPRIRISTECSGGTYIRSLIRDLGEAAGSLAYMDELVRIQQGPIQLNRHTIELEECADLDKVRGALLKTTALAKQF